MLEGKRPPGSRVLVLDCEGYFMGAGMAELLRAHGHEVELVTSCEKVAPLCDETLEGPLLRRHLHDLGIRMRAETWLTRIEPGGVAAETELGETFELEADAVVLVTQRVSHERLYLELRRGRSRAVSTASATASPRGCWPTRSGTAIGSGARSTRPTRRGRCPTCASGRGSRPTRSRRAVAVTEHPALTYSSYLHLDELLACQQPVSEGPEHDELLFIVIHQVYELWFKVLLHELARLQERLEAGDAAAGAADDEADPDDPEDGGRPDRRARDDDPARVLELPRPAGAGERLPVGPVPRARGGARRPRRARARAPSARPGPRPDRRGDGPAGPV